MDFYLEKAFNSSNARSWRQLAEILGKSPGWMALLRRGATLPSDDSMLDIADAAGIDRELALYDLAVMRTRGEPQTVWARLRDNRERTLRSHGLGNIEQSGTDVFSD